jgi:C4-type Zn-finger protein
MFCPYCGGDVKKIAEDHRERYMELVLCENEACEACGFPVIVDLIVDGDPQRIPCSTEATATSNDHHGTQQEKECNDAIADERPLQDEPAPDLTPEALHEWFHMLQGTSTVLEAKRITLTVLSKTGSSALLRQRAYEVVAQIEMMKQELADVLDSLAAIGAQTISCPVCGHLTPHSLEDLITQFTTAEPDVQTARMHLLLDYLTQVEQRIEQPEEETDVQSTD